ncbi:MAG: enoyl-CoA hydratase/isomerase family protein [Hyphomicrobiaceae bacterium]
MVDVGAGRADNGGSKAGSGLRLERQGAAAVATVAEGIGDIAGWQDVHSRLADWYPQLARDAGVYAAIVRTERAGETGARGPQAPSPGRDAATIDGLRAAAASELRLCWLHECFSKPTVGLLNGQIDIRHWLLVAHGTHRVAGEQFCLSFQHDPMGGLACHGVGHALARMPHAIGLYVALTGASLGRADASGLGLVTHCIDRGEFETIAAQLADADPVDPILDDRHRDPGVGPVLAQSARIERYFGAPDLASTLRRLMSPDAGDEDWAGATLGAIRACNPLRLALTYHAVRSAGGFDLRQCLEQDYRIAWRLLVAAAGGGQPDERAGVNADRDPASAFRPGEAITAEAVPEAIIAGYFADLGGAELALPSRAEMQARRV